jgi:hypothetical protein
MPTMEEYLTRPVADRLTRLRSTPDEVARLLDGKDDRALSRRAEARSWAPKEIVCHLRDVEELFLIRFQTILAVEDPPILTLSATPEALAPWGIGGEIGHPLDPDRWAEERQYSRTDGLEALQAFRRRRRACSTGSTPGSGDGAASIWRAAAWSSASGWRAWPATTTTIWPSFSARSN